MAQVVGGFLMPHNPMLTGGGGSGDPAKTANVFAAFDAIRARLAELRVDTVVVVGDDHYTNFGPHCIPRYLIATGDVEGPVEPWLGIDRLPIENHVELAVHIMQSGFAEGIDWAFANALTVDHSIAIPHHFTIKGMAGVRTIPVLLNAAVPPVIDSRRAYDIGRSIRRAITSWPGDERVAVFGTGGISHWVGSVGMGRVNSEFDRHILLLAEAGDVEGLIALPDETVLEQGGNGCLEIKNWICAMGAMPSARAETLAYEAVPEWVTGLGFAELRTAA